MNNIILIALSLSLFFCCKKQNTVKVIPTSNWYGFEKDSSYVELYLVNFNDSLMVQFHWELLGLGPLYIAPSRLDSFKLIKAEDHSSSLILTISELEENRMIIKNTRDAIEFNRIKEHVDYKASFDQNKWASFNEGFRSRSQKYRK